MYSRTTSAVRDVKRNHGLGSNERLKWLVRLSYLCFCAASISSVSIRFLNNKGVNCLMLRIIQIIHPYTRVYLGNYKPPGPPSITFHAIQDTFIAHSVLPVTMLRGGTEINAELRHSNLTSRWLLSSSFKPALASHNLYVYSTRHWPLATIAELSDVYQSTSATRSTDGRFCAVGNPKIALENVHAPSASAMRNSLYISLR